VSRGVSAGFGVAAALTLSVVSAGAQQIANARVVLATVTDSTNQAVVDLGPDDFLIEEQGEEREVLSVYVADYPVVVVLDNSLHSQGDIQTLREAAAGFVRRIGRRQVLLATLSDPPTLVGSFADSQADVLDRISELTINPTTILRPVEAVAMAVEAIRSATATPFLAVVVMSAGATPAPQPESKGLLSSILSSGAIVHVVSRGVRSAAPRASGYRPGFEGDPLRVLADQTSGRYTTVFSAVSYSAALDQIAGHMATEMMIEYLVPSDSDAGPEVRVGVRVPGARVHGLGVTR